MGINKTLKESAESNLTLGITKDYDLYRGAYSLAWISATLDPSSEQALWLSAAAWDRVLMSKKLPQWYGTQYTKASANGPWELYKVDESVVRMKKGLNCTYHR
jgi:hypothetical protein